MAGDFSRLRRVRTFRSTPMEPLYNIARGLRINNLTEVGVHFAYSWFRSQRMNTVMKSHHQGLFLLPNKFVVPISIINDAQLEDQCSYSMHAHETLIFISIFFVDIPLHQLYGGFYI